MAGWIQIHPELVALRLARLRRMHHSAERQYPGPYRVDVIDGHVQVELLGSLTGRPCRCCELGNPLECQPQPVDREHHPVIVIGGDLATEESLVERG